MAVSWCVIEGRKFAMEMPAGGVMHSVDLGYAMVASVDSAPRLFRPALSLCTTTPGFDFAQQS